MTELLQCMDAHYGAFLVFFLLYEWGVRPVATWSANHMSRWVVRRVVGSE